MTEREYIVADVNRPALEYTLRRSERARHARLNIRSDGELVVTLPARAPERWANELLAARWEWVEHHRGRMAAEASRLAARPALDEGRDVPLLGVPHRLEFAPLAADRKRTRIVHDDTGSPMLRLELARGDVRPAATILEGWLRSEARDAVERRVAVRARDLGVEPAGLAIRDQRSRWGSASHQGTVSFNWRLILTPAPILDYVVVHELAHLRQFGHGKRFWSLVHGLVPDAPAARRWLRSHEPDLRRALD
ncbi:MAG: M48 family metallopeptidase [Candidatus Limnocylindrales bacterium]